MHTASRSNTWNPDLARPAMDCRMPVWQPALPNSLPTEVCR